MRLRLAHGVLQHHAARLGARILHLKGSALHPLLAEGRRSSTDCDVLVDPGDVPGYCRLLEGKGWAQVTSFEHGSVFGHAATFHHPLWGTVDVHRSFPGVDRDPALTFETLWAARETRDLGGVDCAVPALPAQRLLLLVHAARDSMGRAGHDVRVSWTDASPTERAEIDALGENLGARVPLALVTDRPERARGGAGEHLWTATRAGAGPTQIWIARLKDARGPRERAALLVAALHVNPDHLALRLGHDPSPQELRRESRDRWFRAARQLRGMLRRRLPGRRSPRPRP